MFQYVSGQREAKNHFLHYASHTTLTLREVSNIHQTDAVLYSIYEEIEQSLCTGTSDFSKLQTSSSNENIDNETYANNVPSVNSKP